MKPDRLRQLFRSSLGASILSLFALIRCGGDDGAVTSPGDQPSNAFLRPECTEWSNRASIARREAQDAAERSCNDAGDCTIVDFGVSCFPDCGYPSAVARAAVAALQAEVQSVDDDNCGRFEELQCPALALPPCGGPAAAPSLSAATADACSRSSPIREP
jgi:hypothetical protein